MGTPWLHVRAPYAKILGIGTNNDGYTDKGITFPSGKAQRALGMAVSSLCYFISALATLLCSHTSLSLGNGWSLPCQPLLTCTSLAFSADCCSFVMMG